MIVDKRISLIYLSVYSCLDKKKVHNLEKTRGTAGRRSPALIHKWNNLTVRYAGLIPPASPSS